MPLKKTPFLKNGGGKFFYLREREKRKGDVSFREKVKEQKTPKVGKESLLKFSLKVRR